MKAVGPFMFALGRREATSDILCPARGICKAGGAGNRLLEGSGRLILEKNLCLPKICIYGFSAPFS